MSGLIPKNKGEFNAQPSEDKLYQIYEEAARARINTDHIRGSLFVNRVLILAFALVSIATCNNTRQLRNNLQNGIHIEIKPGVISDDDKDEDEGDFEQNSEEPQTMKNWQLWEPPSKDSIAVLKI